MTIGSVRPTRPLGLRFIAAFKFAKAAALMGMGIAALGLLSPGRAAWAQDGLETLSIDHGHRLAALLAGQALAILDLTGSRRLGELAVGAFFFAALYAVQGVGLALARIWAEYLTIAVTSSFLPVEVAASWNRWTPLRAGAIVLNIGVVAYLLVQLRIARGSRSG